MLESTPYKDYPVLFVDDEEQAIITFKNLFKDDFTIYTAQNGEEALKILEEHKEIALVATDQRMPKMCGLDLLTIVVEKYPKIINILITAFADLALVIGAVNKGNLYRYIGKPYEEEFLKRTIIQGIERYHMLAVRNHFFDTNKEWMQEGKK